MAQSKLSHILTRPIRTSVERMGLDQERDSKRLNDCKRQGADQPSTRAGWSVPLLFTTVKHTTGSQTFCRLSLFFVRFLLYVVYVFALCSTYLEDNKVSI